MEQRPKLAVVGGVQWPESGGYPIVFVEQGGAVREVTAEERAYLETEFELDDGARPHVMARYRGRAWWQLFGGDWGFCPRHTVPSDVHIRAE